MDLKEIQNRNYQATIRRGKITPATTGTDFIEKIKEETGELQYEEETPLQNKIEKGKEMADVIIAVLNYAKHEGINIQTALEQKTIYNENRHD